MRSNLTANVVLSFFCLFSALSAADNPCWEAISGGTQLTEKLSAMPRLRKQLDAAIASHDFPLKLQQILAGALQSDLSFALLTPEIRKVAGYPNTMPQFYVPPRSFLIGMASSFDLNPEL